MGSKKDCSLQIKTLGTFEVRINGHVIPETAWPRRRTKELLKVLLTQPGKSLTADQLIDALLPDANVSSAHSNIQARVSELRRVLEPDLARGRDSQYIRSVGEGYMFDLDSDCWIDTVAFDRNLAEAFQLADGSAWLNAVDAFESFVTLYGGEFLAEDRYADWAENTRDRLRVQYLDGLTRLAFCFEELERHRQAISCYRKVLAVDPCREDAARQLMRIQGELGHRAQALQTYNQLERTLRKQLDVEPSEQTKTLFQRLSKSEPGKAEQLDPLRVAVIPFVNVGSDTSNDFLADGMTEELIYTISKVASLEVIAQTTALKYKGARKSVAEIGQELRVGSLLEGSTQMIGSRARILVQLINVENEAHLWAEQYDRDVQDILGVQGEIARKVASELKVQLLAKEESALRHQDGPSSAAHAAYMRGRFFLGKSTREGCRKAIESFEQAISIAPDYARALTGLADAYCRIVVHTTAEEGYTKAREYAERALALDGTLAEAHCSLAMIAANYDHNVEEAERLLQLAIELDPNCARAHANLATLLASTDRIVDGIEAGKAALALDPLSAPLTIIYADCLYSAARFHEAIEQARKAIDLDPEVHNAWWILWYSLGATWDWDRAEAVLRTMVSKYPENPCGYVYLAMCVQSRGRIEEGVALMEKALSLPGATEEVTVLFYCGNGYYFARQYDQAEHYYRKVLAKSPSSLGARVLLAKCHVQRERFDEALAEMDATEKKYGLTGEYWLSHVHMERGRIYALRGEIEKAEAELELLIDGAGRQNRRFAVAVVLYVLGRVDEALQWAEDAVDAREPHVNAFRKAPDFPPAMRDHPRFQALLKRIGLGD